MDSGGRRHELGAPSVGPLNCHYATTLRGSQTPPTVRRRTNRAVSLQVPNSTTFAVDLERSPISVVQTLAARFCGHTVRSRADIILLKLCPIEKSVLAAAGVDSVALLASCIPPFPRVIHAGTDLADRAKRGCAARFASITRLGSTVCQYGQGIWVTA
jgi:hypothetical protein